MNSVAETVKPMLPQESAAEVERVESDALALPDRARALAVTTDEQYVAAGEFLKGAKATAAQVKAVFDPIVAKAHEAHKTATAARSQMLQPIEEAERIVKGAMVKFVDQREAERRAAERKAADEALRKAEEERIARAVELEAEGKSAEAEVEIARPLVAAPVAPVAIAAPPKVAGVSTKKVWRFEIVDVSAIKREFMVPNETAIRKAVESLNEGAAAVVGGIRVYQETVIAGQR